MRNAILVGVCSNQYSEFEENLEEMKQLAAACDIAIETTITQRLKTPHKKTYINQGKVEEVIHAINDTINLILFDAELTPSQQHHLEDSFQREVVDKTYLILQIFEQRAKTKEATLQVAAALLKYQKPRLAGSYASLDRQRGGNKNKGTGEKKLEMDSRTISKAITKVEKELKEISEQRNIQRSQRKKKAIKSVALVGYTNAGKSSIMNGLMECMKKRDKLVFEKDMLFATLTTNTRSITSNNHHHFVISDTVGFLSDLPHSLIQAFHSTLEEVVMADLLVQVIDSSSKNYGKHMATTKDTLATINAGHIPILTVFNKCDISEFPYPIQKDNCLYLCAKDRESIELLINAIDHALYHDVSAYFFIPYQNSSLLPILNQNCQILSQEYQQEGTLLHIQTEETLFQKLKKTYPEFYVDDKKKHI